MSQRIYGVSFQSEVYTFARLYTLLKSDIAVTSLGELYPYSEVE